MKHLIPVVGHISKVFIDTRDAKKIVKKGSGVMVNGVLHCLRSGIRRGSPGRPVEIRDYDCVESVMEYRHKQSGDYGPIVLQGKRGIPFARR